MRLANRLSMLTAAAAIALLVWVAVLLLPSQPHRTRERLAADSAARDLGEVSALIPARNEAAVIERTLAALIAQGPALEIIVIDDDSSDDTAAVCELFGERVTVIRGAALPDGWAGKLWALEQGLAHVRRPHTLLLDADIELGPGTVSALLAQAQRSGATLVSVMATLRCETFWERLLVPPFVYFFKLLYPFALVNAPGARQAAAAGGCMLVETGALRAAGGFAAMRDALIDDCTLARRLKARGHGIWLGLGRSVRSLRGYPRLADFWRMVSRSAYTQLGYSPLRLLVTTVVMLVVFAAPVAALPAAPSPAAGAAAIAAMSVAYAPVVRFYRLPVLWTLTLPLAAALFLAMTWSSAFAYWRGTRATWKNRIYDARS